MTSQAFYLHVHIERRTVHHMHTHHTIKRVFVAVAVTFGLIALSGCASNSDNTDNTKNDVVSTTESAGTAAADMIKPDRTLFIGDTYDDGYLRVRTSLEEGDEIQTITIEYEPIRDANFFLEHWFVVTSKGRIMAFEPLVSGEPGGTVSLPTMAPGETFAIQYWQFGDRYAALIKQPGM